MTKFTGTVLALDLATITGWAHGKPGEAPNFGSVQFGKPGTSRAKIYRAFREWLETVWNARNHQPDLIVFESPAVPSIMGGRTHVDTTKMLFGLSEHLEEWAYEKFELREASVSQVRSHFIGGNFKSKIAKPMVMERCVELGWKTETYDQSDACALWDYQCCFLRPELAVMTTRLFANQR